ncbi:hypothetical protein DFR86_08160 [Acidianus sulfidivorans JP7]|uniref:Uncharacterized protein n=1 Tax=Acidianus sulfidivorans JP7 TaxID=619593 RepID=A0A2U9INE9_9CREN|nr:hypothetical protein [Acidianus sulfidivorans]AWR97527.1 hypothetical protein DFR86_08160 [Acidianus sulfidivorans JP7]
MNLPDEIKNILHDNSCIVCCDEFVLCKTDDLPKRYDAKTDLEVDREKGQVILRNIIKDDPDNPLYIEYFVNKKFVDRISRDMKIDIIFVDNNWNERAKYTVKLMKEDISIIRREIGLGT